MRWVILLLVILFSAPAAKLFQRAGTRMLSTPALAAPQDEEELRKTRLLSQVQNALNIHSGSMVADVGTGDTLFHQPHIARLIGPAGKLYCEDISQAALKTLAGKFEELGIRNVEMIVGKLDDPTLPEKMFDAILISNAYHEMAAYTSMLKHIRAALKPGGRLVVIESISDGTGASREAQA